MRHVQFLLIFDLIAKKFIFEIKIESKKWIIYYFCNVGSSNEMNANSKWSLTTQILHHFNYLAATLTDIE